MRHELTDGRPSETLALPCDARALLADHHGWAVFCDDALVVARNDGTPAASRCAFGGGHGRSHSTSACSSSSPRRDAPSAGNHVFNAASLGVVEQDGLSLEGPHGKQVMFGTSGLQHALHPFIAKLWFTSERLTAMWAGVRSLIRLAGFALPGAFCAMHLISVRHDETHEIAWNGSSPPQYGWPLPWTAWNGVSSLEWIVSPLPMIIDLFVYALPFLLIAGAMDFFAKRNPAVVYRVWNHTMLAMAVVFVAFAALAGLVPSVIGLHQFETLRPITDPEMQLCIGVFGQFAR